MTGWLPRLWQQPSAVTAMALALFGAPQPTAPAAAVDYRPGVCNIGPDEIRWRRRSGHLGVIASVVLLVALLAVGAPPLARLLVALPAAGAAAGYLQARLRFCAAFGWRGVLNFGRLGRVTDVADADARRRDRAMALRIGLASAAIGLGAGVGAVLLPI